jgi:hypothetical protein
LLFFFDLFLLPTPILILYYFSSIIRHSDPGTVWRGSLLLKAFFKTTKEFKNKEEVKKSIDFETLLSLFYSNDESVVNYAGWLLYTVYSIYSSPWEDGKEHPDMKIMESNGKLRKMNEIFLKCEKECGKRLIGLVILDICRTKEIDESMKNIILWIMENTKNTLDSLLLRNTLVAIRRLVFSLMDILCFHLIFDFCSFLFSFLRFSNNYVQSWNSHI